MKKIYLLILALVGAVAMLPAQDLGKPWLGVRAGVNFSNLSSPDYSTGYLTGFGVGVTYRYPLSRAIPIPIYIGSGLYFQKAGAQDNGFLVENGGESRLTKYEVEVPLLFAYHIPLSSGWSLLPAAGLYYSVAVNGKFEIGGKEFNPYRPEPIQTLRDSVPIEQQLLHRSDFGIRVEVSALYENYLFGFSFDGGLVNNYTLSFREFGYHALSGCFTLFFGRSF